MNNYYVYVYWRLDINEPFYVGKGKNDRWKDLDRKCNNHFMNLINKHPIVVTIEKDNLTEDEAFYWEEKIIEILVFEYRFSIEIFANNSNNHYCHLVNQTWGGEGCSKPLSAEHKEKLSIAFSGKNNPNYGKVHTEETKEKISKKAKERLKNKKNNPMYKKHHSEEAKRKIGEKHKGKIISEETKMKMSESTKGKNNPMYGKDWREGKTEEELKEIKERQIKNIPKGRNCSNAKSVICLTTKRIFFTVKEASEYYGCSNNIILNCKGKIKYCGKLSNGTPLKWKYLIWKHNKKYRIKNKIVSNR